MRLLLDTTVLVDHLRRRPDARELIDEANERGDELWSVTVVRTEVLTGMRQGEERRTEELLDRIRWLPVSRELADLAGAFGRRYVRARPGVSPVDLLVAASAAVLGAEVRTLNVRDFPMFPGLRAAY